MELLKRDLINRDKLPFWKRDALEKFEMKMMDKHKPFPCIPATQGFSLNHLQYAFVGDPREDSSSHELAELLSSYTLNSKELGRYTSLIVFFNTPPELSDTYNVEKFEQLFWKQLNKLTELDSVEWPNHIPSDPTQPAWEFCFHGEQYFMYCATPAHKNRSSRSFPYFMLAITPRWVLELFNSSPSYSKKIKENIRKRLSKYDSISVHPDLNTYGNSDNFEWKQYFLHDDDSTLTKCPFHKLINEVKKYR
ncbi:YqcI/YcgG family protein [Metabacillus halosaccharovorans]|uniref:YqcI/YcgG family protein n=1 Tax=Metabacillus halosaccharovorans TaxID=930124 RepID=UPI00203D1DAF|nr:YqcI/YcgG family protein [Metabacillus halosaccharovorans]MCM3440209.1 YqcI/YcgG family protein [Metabacillus halosaccharovorans]